MALPPLARITSLFAACSLLACKTEPAPSPAASAPKSANSQRVARPAPPPSAPPQVTAAALVEPAPEAKDVGDWADARPYKVKVSSIKRCDRSNDKADKAAAPGRAKTLGIMVHIYSKYDQLLVASRDVTLERDGVILNSEISPEPTPGCGPLLQPRQVQHDQTASGVVVFQIPEEFDARSATLVYKATRWGGAPRVEIKLPDCLDQCKKEKQ